MAAMQESSVLYHLYNFMADIQQMCIRISKIAWLQAKIVYGTENEAKRWRADSSVLGDCLSDIHH